MIQSVVKQGNDEWVTQYEYDALSRRISKTSQYYTDVYDHHRTLVEYKSKKQLFYWQGLRLAGESEASKTENRRWYAYEENSYAPLALIDHWHEIDKDEIVYYHTQLNGAPYALSSAQGELIFETEEYLWGNYRRPAKNQVTLLYGQPLRFQGQYFDQETGLHYNTFRYYDPETGRFTQQDPIGLAGGINLYQYAPNPLSWIDPLGWSCSFYSGKLSIQASEMKPLVRGSKEWNQAIKEFQKALAKGEKFQVKVRTSSDAKAFLKESQGNMNRYKAHTQSKRLDGVPKYPKGYEQHMEPENGLGDALHIKWYNNGTDGHIFYDIPN
ncbi:RHS repeat-associated core domain-containing protein [Thorsellia kenyensis]|uniref:RHS repeat-associated core domain-containing protein n=1 Tax=Thorsellia kenyensis TaxID=1549888 RepID=A0ABV6C6C9_9GAMM